MSVSEMRAMQPVRFWLSRGMIIDKVAESLVVENLDFGVLLGEPCYSVHADYVDRDGSRFSRCIVYVEEPHTKRLLEKIRGLVKLWLKRMDAKGGLVAIIDELEYTATIETPRLTVCA